MLSHSQFPFPALEQMGIAAEIPCRLPHTVAVFGHQANRFALAFCCRRLAFLGQHGTPPESILSLFPKGPFLLNHNKLERPYFYCRPCHLGDSPFDEAVGLVAGGKQLDMHKAAVPLVTEVPYDTASRSFTSSQAYRLGANGCTP